MIFLTTVFVDWNSQIHAIPPPKAISEIQLASRVLTHIGNVIGRVITASNSLDSFDVTIRVYHGWHRGFKVTDRKKALIQVVGGMDFPGLTRSPLISIRDNVEFGDKLISGLPARFHQRLNCHLPNTLRYRIEDQKRSEEKMVDTSLASDLVDLAHREPERWLIVMGEDDDLVPPILVAEGARGRGGGKVILVRSRPDTTFLKLDGIRYKP